MSFLDNLKFWARTTEKDVLAFAVRVWNEEKVLAAEVLAAAKWVVGSGIPALNSEVQTLQPLVGLIATATGHPELKVSSQAFAASMAGLNAFAVAVNAGNVTADQVVEGYSSLKQATAAAQNMAATAANIVAVTQPSTLPAKA